MGTCFPGQLSGPDGFIQTWQPGLRKVYLVTDPDCDLGSSHQKNLEFPNIQEFSWKGLRKRSHCRWVKALLRSYHKQITFLELDFADLKDMQDQHSYIAPTTPGQTTGPTPLAEMILPCPLTDGQEFLPKLRTLSISNAPFEGDRELLAEAFKITKVKNLKLLKCSSTSTLLHEFWEDGTCLGAIRVELMLSDFDEDVDIESRLTYLSSFHALEDLFLMFEKEDETEYSLDLLFLQRPTLRRLVLHGRYYGMTPIAPYENEYHDSSFHQTFVEGLDTLLVGAGIECLGVCEMPGCLQRAFKAIAPTTESLKLLHIRFTGLRNSRPIFFDIYNSLIGLDEDEVEQAFPAMFPIHELKTQWRRIKNRTWLEEEKKELETFANWAFGAHGFPNLQVIAYGDFSYGKRFATTQRFLCRETYRPTRNKKWRPVQLSDAAHLELIEENMDMLSACPVSQLSGGEGRPNVFPG